MQTMMRLAMLRDRRTGVSLTLPASPKSGVRP